MAVNVKEGCKHIVPRVRGEGKLHREKRPDGTCTTNRKKTRGENMVETRIQGGTGGRENIAPVVKSNIN